LIYQDQKLQNNVIPGGRKEVMKKVSLVFHPASYHLGITFIIYIL